MAFISDLSKQAQGIIFFSHKTPKISHPKLNVNNSPVVQSTCQKHLGLYFRGGGSSGGGGGWVRWKRGPWHLQ